MAPQPTGTVTMLFTDVEGSTRLLDQLGLERYSDALDLHRRLLREAFELHDGYEVDCAGDSFFVAFSTAEAAVSAASEAQRSLAAAAWPDGDAFRVRMGVHTGEPLVVHPQYVGIDVHKAARIMAAGHGEQVLLSRATCELLDSRTAVLDLGEHRLKDLGEPQGLFQLLIDGLPTIFPAPRTLENRPTNLPVQLNMFIGRLRELQQVGAILRRPETRLLTLTGPGGTGKTRLGLHVAAELVEDHSDGAYLVALASIRDPALVLPTIARTLGLREQGNVPIAATLTDFVRDRTLLLLLDNFEHVLDAGPDVASMLASAPGLKLLVTSRAPLRLSAERVFPVPPLDLPGPDARDPTALTHYDAVALFVERARAAQPNFEVTNENAPAVADICLRLDGLPLALELAGARVGALGPRALLARLEKRLAFLTGGARDSDERQRTLRNTIEWSYDLLTPEEQELFGSLAVFVGGCGLETACAVCRPDAEDEGVMLELLVSLVDKSLLRQTEDADGEPRFWMLETIREYAAERLDAAATSATLRGRHLRWFLALAERFDAELRGHEQGLALDRLEAENDNFRAALRFALDDAQATEALRLVGALGSFWRLRGYVSEGRAWAAAALSLGGPAEPSDRGRALQEAGNLALHQSDHATADASLSEALLVARRIGDAEGETRCLALRAFSMSARGVHSEAHELAEQAVSVARERTGPATLAQVLRVLGSVYVEWGRSDEAQSVFEESLQLLDGLDDALATAQTLADQAWALELDGRHAEAIALCERVLQRVRTLGAVENTASVLHTYGLACLGCGDDVRAVQALRESLALAFEAEDRLSTAYVLDALAAASAREDPRQAAQLAGLAEAIAASAGTPLNPRARALVAARIEEARAALGPRWDEERERGRLQAPDVLIRIVLAARPGAGSAVD
jgi:predicted ATPase/class 3 adenylate cyclase